MSRIRVGVKYCGHCNPLFEGVAIVEAAAALDRQIEFVPWTDPGKSVLLILSCCPTGCVERPAFNGAVVDVAGNRMDGKVMPVTAIAAALVKTIRERVHTA